MERKNEKPKKNTALSLIPVLLFLAFVAFMMIRTAAAEEVRAAVTETKVSAESLGDLSDTFEEVLQENIYAKNHYIDLNGLTTRVLGINSLNERYRLADGSLARTENARDTTVISENLIELYGFLEERGIDFLYLQAPSKETFYDVRFFPGYDSDGWKTVDGMLSALADAGVPYLDMNAWFEENGWQMDDVFFVTDHHWLPEAGLAAAGCTMEFLERSGAAVYDRTLLEEDSYDIAVLEDWFLGSAGKRVGQYYAGVDDISVYFPKFATDYTFAALSEGTTDWIYADSPLNLAYLNGKDYYGSNPYCIYLYGNNPIQVVTNAEAPNAKRLLIFGDSFRMPLEYFLTSQFQEIWYVDLRYYTDGTLAQFIAEIQPDIALMCIEPSYMTAGSFTFGTGEYMEALDATSADGADAEVQSGVSLEAREADNDHFSMLFENLEPGQTYTLTVDSTSYSGGADRFVQMTLQDLSADEAVCNRYFDANSGETQRWIFTVPEGTDTYAIYFYAGTKGHTAGVSAEVAGVELRRGVYED